MKTSLTLAALLGALTSAHAQAPTPGGVQLYGVLDTGVEHLSNVGASGASVTRMPSLSGGQLPSRWGLRGNEELGGGLKAVFTLESGFGVDNGTALQGGRAFGRQAFVGLSAPWGTLTLGRHWTMSFHSMLDADVVGPAVFGSAALDPYLPNARTDNAIAYRGSFGALTVGATYSLGRDALAPANCAGENTARECRAWSAMVKYDAPRWGVALAHDLQKGGAAGNFFGQPPGTLPAAGNQDRRTLLTGYARLGSAKIGAGWIQRRLRASPTPLSTDLVFVGANVPLSGAWSVDAQVLQLRDERPDANARMLVLRGNYALSRRTSAYALLGRVSNDRLAAYSISAGELASAAPLAGRGQTGFMLGMRHSF
jgi:predicted porin